MITTYIKSINMVMDIQTAKAIQKDIYNLSKAAKPEKDFLNDLLGEYPALYEFYNELCISESEL